MLPVARDPAGPVRRATERQWTSPSLTVSTGSSEPHRLRWIAPTKDTKKHDRDLSDQRHDSQIEHLYLQPFAVHRPKLVERSRLSQCYDDSVVAREESLCQQSAGTGRRAKVRAVVDRGFDRTGRIDAEVSNAGHGRFSAAEKLSDAEIDRQIATNLTGSIN